METTYPAVWDALGTARCSFTMEPVEGALPERRHDSVAHNSVTADTSIGCPKPLRLSAPISLTSAKDLAEREALWSIKI